MREQVSGSLTLSLAGLADELAARMEQALDRRLDVMPPETVVRLLTSYGIPYEQASAIAGQMDSDGLGLVLLSKAAQPRQHTDQATGDTFTFHGPAAVVTDPESAEQWFRDGVNGQ